MGCGAHEGRQQQAVFPRLSRTLNSLRTTTASQPQRHKKSGNLTFFFFSVSSSASFTPRLTPARSRISRIAAIPLASAPSHTEIITCMQSRLVLRIASERASGAQRSTVLRVRTGWRPEVMWKGRKWRRKVCDCCSNQRTLKAETNKSFAQNQCLGGCCPSVTRWWIITQTLI